MGIQPLQFSFFRPSVQLSRNSASSDLSEKTVFHHCGNEFLFRFNGTFGTGAPMLAKSGEMFGQLPRVRLDPSDELDRPNKTIARFFPFLNSFDAKK